MVDFHSHFLPGIDDGSDCVETSLAMLRECRRQGVGLMCATPHFYADETDPASFLRRRNAAWKSLREAMVESGEKWPRVLLGAEVLFFPGISMAEEIAGLCLQGTPFLLIEPPMMHWSNSMLDEIEQCGETLDCVPVLAHIDRYMRILNDYSLFERVEERDILIQVNAGFFLNRRTEEIAVEHLVEKRFHFIGSDCHNMEERRPNMADAAQVVRRNGASREFSAFNQHLYHVLGEAVDSVDYPYALMDR
jgi:protein-tyrosine phosphatase